MKREIIWEGDSKACKSDSDYQAEWSRTYRVILDLDTKQFFFELKTDDDALGKPVWRSTKLIPDMFLLEAALYMYNAKIEKTAKVDNAS